MVTRKYNVPNMILIGSTARNSGKTTLASLIIKKYKLNRAVVGLKVTTIHDKNKKCIHGGEGCGVCSSLKGNFEINQELNTANNKDTSLLLAAGAAKVCWLKTLKNSIYEGFEAFITQIPENTLIVCESNSLRNVVNPGVFIMVKNTRDGQIKKSASEVIDQADIIVENNFDDNFEKIIKKIESIVKSVSEGQAAATEEITATLEEITASAEAMAQIATVK